MAALKVRPGDEVITTAHSVISTSGDDHHAGATVVFADTDGATFNIDPAAIEAAITARTVASFCALYGQPADMDAIMGIASRHGLWVRGGLRAGAFGALQGTAVGTSARLRPIRLIRARIWGRWATPAPL